MAGHWCPILNPNIQVSNSPTLKSILHGWSLAAKSLEFKFREGTIPRLLTVEQLLSLYRNNREISEEDLRAIRIFLSNKQIKNVGDLMNDNGSWTNPIILASLVRSMRQAGEEEFKVLHNDILEEGNQTEAQLPDSVGWSWSNSKPKARIWATRNQEWTKRISPSRTDNVKLNKQWRQ